MKNLFLPAATAVTMCLALTSCLGDGDDSSASTTYSTAVLVTSIDPAATGDYTNIAIINPSLEYNYSKQTVSMSLSELSLDGGSLSFSTPDLTYNSYYVDYGLVQKFGCETVASTGVASQVKDLEVMLTTAINYPSTLGVGEQQGVNSFSFQPDAMLMTLAAGDKYRLLTLPKIALYKGVTSLTSSPSPADPSDSSDPSDPTDPTDPSDPSDPSDSSEFSEFSDISYRVAIDPASKLATIAIFNTKGGFSSNTYAIFIKDLPLAAAEGTYSVKGSNVRYQVFNGAKWTSDDSYVLSEITLRPAVAEGARPQTAADLAKVTVTYTTPDGRRASFTGTYLAN